jgi:hypothetical protein
MPSPEDYDEFNGILVCHLIGFIGKLYGMGTVRAFKISNKII